ncbi:MAG: hypothetical protein WC807_19400 [Hyphomicrobium sp.]
MFAALLVIAAEASVIGQWSTPDARAQNVPYRAADEVPGTWREFAMLVKAHFQKQLAPESGSIRHLLKLLERDVGKANTEQVVIVLKAWIGSDGKVELVQFDNITDPDVAVELRDALTSGSLGSAPPFGMLQPLHIKLSLPKSQHLPGP